MNSFGYKNNKESDISEKALKFTGRQNDTSCRMSSDEKVEYATQYNKSLASSHIDKDYDYETTPIEKIRHSLFCKNAIARQNHICVKDDGIYTEEHHIHYKDILDIVLELWDKNEKLENEVKHLRNQI